MPEEIVYLTELLGLKVYDLKGRRIGTLRDAALVPLIDPVRVDRFLVGAGPGWLSIRYDQVKEIAGNGLRLKDERLSPYHSDEYMLRIGRDLLDQQIIDAHGRKLVRVNDVTFLKANISGSCVLKVLEVDIGLRSIMRRVLQGVLPPATIRSLQSRIAPYSIRWEFCNMLEPDPQRRVRLNITNTLIEKMHPADLADIVEGLGHEDRQALFSTMNSEVAAETLSEVEPDLQAQIVESLETEKAAEILEEMDASAAADVLNELEEDRSEEILDEMEPADKEDLEELLEFRDDRAGGLMDNDFVSLLETATVAEGIAELRKSEDAIEEVHSLFLVDQQDRLRYTVPISKLFFAPGDMPLMELASDPLVSLTSDDRQDRIAELFDKYNLLACPVVDQDEKLIGVITVDEVVSVLRHG